MSPFELVPHQAAPILAPVTGRRPSASGLPLHHAWLPVGPLVRTDTPAPVEPHPGVPPGTPVQEIVRNLFAQTLGVPRGTVDADSDFFRLGGSPADAARLLERVARLFGDDPGPDGLSSAPTPARFAALIGDPAPTATGPRTRPGHSALLPLRLQGPLDEKALDHALADLGHRHEALRNSRLGNVGTRLRTLGTDDRLLELALPADVIDPWAVWPLASELARAYRARVTGGLPHRTPCTPETTPRAREGDRAPTPLPGSSPHDRHEERHVLAHQVPASVHRHLTRCAAAHDVTLFMLVHTALTRLVAERGAPGPVTVAAPVPARHCAALRDAVAPHSRILALTVDTAGRPDFAELLSRTKAAHLAAYRAPDAPLATPGGIALTVLAELPGTLHAANLSITPQQPVHAAPCATLSLTLTEHHDAAGDSAGLTLLTSYQLDAVAQESADTLSEDLVAALAAVPYPEPTPPQARSGVRSS
ncbi:phosphopantetheine-binding protein [Streptomyces sp. MK7]|uniref:phosphopantetheine-binding protein n=1 Tax=Streptomyces sp. MK7 TaxID=3067635 RepID=UPI002930D61D|nr:phosphopantetheine-binding protein [Streptomyces sp. MK7]